MLCSLSGTVSSASLVAASWTSTEVRCDQIVIVALCLVYLCHLPPHTHPSIPFLSLDAIVNAANTGCLGGGGVDGAISSAGGEDLYQARRALPELNSRGLRCKTGDAKITIGGDLNARFCIHAGRVQVFSIPVAKSLF
jgi:hypothetical protein